MRTPVVHELHRGVQMVPKRGSRTFTQSVRDPSLIREEEKEEDHLSRYDEGIVDS